MTADNCSNLEIFTSKQDVICQVKEKGRKLVIFDQFVYDVKHFLEAGHPGGNNFIESEFGTDIKDKMEARGHSKKAYLMMEKYKIGVIGPKESKFPVNEISDTIDEKVKKSLREKIDLSKGLFYQIFSKDLTKDEYLAFIHDPKILDNPPREVRIFESNFLEFFSKTYWLMIPLIYLPLLTLVALPNLKRFDGSIFFLFFLIMFGFLLWTLSEYVLHRFVFHSDKHLPNRSPILYCTHFLIHGVHHAFPQDRLRLVFPVFTGLILAALLILTFPLIYGEKYGTIILLGFGIGYVVYDTHHYIFHHLNLNTPYHRLMQNYHLKHHFKGEEKGYGVSSFIWDLVFNTFMQ